MIHRCVFLHMEVNIPNGFLLSLFLWLFFFLFLEIHERGALTTTVFTHFLPSWAAISCSHQYSFIQASNITDIHYFHQSKQKNNNFISIKELELKTFLNIAIISSQTKAVLSSTGNTNGVARSRNAVLGDACQCLVLRHNAAAATSAACSLSRPPPRPWWCSIILHRRSKSRKNTSSNERNLMYKGGVKREKKKS